MITLHMIIMMILVTFSSHRHIQPLDVFVKTSEDFFIFCDACIVFIKALVKIVLILEIHDGFPEFHENCDGLKDESNLDYLGPLDGHDLEDSTDMF